MSVEIHVEDPMNLGTYESIGYADLITIQEEFDDRDPMTFQYGLTIPGVGRRFSAFLPGFTGIANPALYGGIYSELRSENRELQSDLEEARKERDAEKERVKRWRGWHRSDLYKANEKISKLEAELEAAKAKPVDDSVVQEYEERIERLQRNFVKSFDSNVSLRGRISELEKELEASESRINEFIERYNEGAAHLIDAAEAWNAEVPA